MSPQHLPRRVAPRAGLSRLLALALAGAAALGLGAGLAPETAHAEAAASSPAGAGPASVSNRLDAILARGVLRVGTTGDYKPFSYRVGSSDTVIGLDLDLAADLARSLGVRLEVVPTTWPTLMADLQADRFDLAMGGVSVTLDRQRRAMFSVPYLRDGKTPIARCGDVAKYQSIAQIDQPGVRLVVNPGGTNERFARAYAPKAALTVWPDNVTIFDRIVSGDADVMITDAIEARLQARLHPQLCAIHPEAPFDFSEKAVLLPRDLVLKAYVDQWLHQAIESGSFKRLHERWLDYPWGIESLRQSIEWRLQLAPDVARWKWNHHLDIEDPVRERQVLEVVAAQAAALGVPRHFADAFFRAQIEASKTVQHEMFMGWEVLKTGAISDVPDLQTVTRPRIDAVTAQMVHALASNWRLIADPERRADVARALRPIDAESLSLKAVEQALAPLLDVKRYASAPEAAPADGVAESGDGGLVTASSASTASSPTAAASTTTAAASLAPASTVPSSSSTSPAASALAPVAIAAAVAVPSSHPPSAAPSTSRVVTGPAGVAIAATTSSDAAAPTKPAVTPRTASPGVVAAMHALTTRGPTPSPVPAAKPAPKQAVTIVAGASRAPTGAASASGVTMPPAATVVARGADPVAELVAKPPAAGASGPKPMALPASMPGPHAIVPPAPKAAASLPAAPKAASMPVVMAPRMVPVPPVAPVAPIASAAAKAAAKAPASAVTASGPVHTP